MLSEILFAGVKTEREERGDRVSGLTCSGLYPCPFRLYLAHLGKVWREKLEPRDILNMEDGWDQEAQTKKRLFEKAGIRVRDVQASVSIGRSGMGGHIDGTITLNGKRHLWEHKAMNEDRFRLFNQWGLRFFPNFKAQINAYMLGMELDSCIIMAKYKDGNDYCDHVESLDGDFILPIIEWADRIKIDGWVPEPEECKYCAHCGIGCFGPILDFSWLKTVSAPEMANKWREGDKLAKVGNMLKDEARTFFVGKKDREGNVLAEGIIGDKNVLYSEGLKIMRVIQHRTEISRQAILEEFGADALLRVMGEKDVETFRIGED